ncbi:glycerophosphoryl diester phosphodiesterase membrane domain-containing protein [Nonomuraea terrae]|uniref:glycerophosphoryl diester phosphodiesterase membrane domain-containing protein n=1 Tax=Nonomuraea terrae TaxID=2530383 RepID=UPI001FE26466|nr:glycerophosphoryl diester phosphodiesterase membrane domain-containing protein [Nonomuraea terrae]
MSDGHGPMPETPSGWSAEQPPPYSAPPASPWTAPGSQQQVPYGGQPHGQPPYQQAPAGHGPGTPYPPYAGQGPGYGYMPPPPALRPGIIPLHPLRLGDVLDGTIKLIRSNPKSVLGLSAAAALVVSVPVALGQAYVFDSAASIAADPGSVTTGDLYGSLAVQYGGTLISLAVQFVVVTMLTGVLTRILGRAVFGGTVSAGEAWRLVKGRVGALFGVVALMAVIMVVPLIVFVLLMAALATTGEFTLVAVATLLFIVAYFVYYLFFKTRFAFAPAAVVLEGRGPIDAMRRSWQLVTGDFWRVLGILLLTWILVGIVSTVLAFPFSFAGTMFSAMGAGTAATAIVSALFLTIGYTIGSMLTYPFEAGVAGLLYADRRMRAEAFDLVLQTAAIEQQRQGWVHSSADDLWHPSNSARP